MTPFTIDVPQTVIARINRRVRDFEWHEMPRGAQGDKSLEDTWAYGANLDFLRELCAYWIRDYDWRQWEAAFNRIPQYKAEAGGFELHFFLEKGSGPAPKPLILSHGWPGSVFEFLHVIEPLAHPERFGGDVKDAFTVVVPSLPGYGWSQKPSRPIGPRTTARMFDTLMTDVLQLRDYIAQGGDWGSAISGWMGYEGKGCRAVHMNMLGWVSPGVHPETPEEIAHAKTAAQRFSVEGAYFREQTTKPQTLSYGMMDSPVGAAAWIIEKFHGWSDIRQGFANTYTKDQLITNVMIYLVTKTFNTASWMYRGRVEESANFPPVPKGTKITRPVGIAAFPFDLSPFPPRSLAERSLNIVHWTDFAKGGHFAALERGDDLVNDVRKFARLL